MVKIHSIINFFKWNLFHPADLIFVPRWFFDYRASMLNLEMLWSNYKVNAYLDKTLLGNESVLEFGSGGSTLFFSKRTKKVTSIEHDKNWFSKIKLVAPKNCQILLKSPTNYLKINGKYDVVFIDGIRRLDCAKKALSLVKKNGIIIVDDSNWPNSQGAGEYLESIGLKQISFKGIKPGDFNIWETKIFFV